MVKSIMVNRIVFISNFRKDYGGGEGVVAYEMPHHFAPRYQVGFILPDDRTEIYTAESGVQVFTVASNGAGNLTMPILSQRNIRLLFNFLDYFDPEIVHAHDPTLISVLGQVWCKLRGVPFFFTSHVLPWKILEFGTNEALWIPARSMTEALVKDFFHHFYLNCDAIICMNQVNADYMRHLGYNHRVFVVPNARHLDHFTSCRLADLSCPVKTLTFIGFFSQRKNQVYLLQVLKLLPPGYRMVLIGEALNPLYQQEIEAFIQANGLKNVTIPGKVDQSEIPGYLERSHVFVSASRMEVQSLVIIEALASGTPVVGLSNETLDELVDGEVGAWLPKDARAEEFACQVERLCSLSQAEYEQICQNARQRVRGLDWDDVRELTVQAYESLLREHPAHSPLQSERLAKLVASLPSRSVRRFLFDQTARVKKVRRVTGKTWLFAGVNVLTSLLAHPFMRAPGTSFRWHHRA